MNASLRRRRVLAVIVCALGVAVSLFWNNDMWQPAQQPPSTPLARATGKASELLETIAIKGRAAKSDYKRTQFGNGWAEVRGCDMRNIILHRDLKYPTVGDDCKVRAGVLDDPYTGKTIEFKRGADSSDDVQIDHVVALSDAWQKGAQQLTKEEREALANDPLELLAVDGDANQKRVMVTQRLGCHQTKISVASMLQGRLP